MGYYGLFLGLRYQNTQQFTQRLDADNYNVAEEVLIKIPITIPYATDSKEFERVNGEFEHNGEFYRLVKQRLSNDTLYVVCIKDHTSKRINEALADYVKTFTDNPGNTSHSVNTLPNFIKDYVGNSFSIKPVSVGWSTDVNNQSPPKTLVSSFLVSIVHPPERA
jgi:hypothetical protein